MRFMGASCQNALSRARGRSPPNMDAFASASGGLPQKKTRALGEARVQVETSNELLGGALLLGAAEATIQRRRHTRSGELRTHHETHEGAEIVHGWKTDRVQALHRCFE